MNIQKVRTLEMTDTMTGHIITDFNTQVTDPDANVASYGLTKGINDNLALKQPLSTILTMLTNSNIKTYEIQLNSVINTIAKLQTYISMRNFEVGTEVSSFKLSNSGQFFGLMVSNSPSSTLTSGMFFGYDYDDVAFFTKNNGSVTIYHLNKTKKYPAS